MRLRMLAEREEKVSKEKNRLVYIGLILISGLILSSWLASSYYLHALYGGPSAKSSNATNNVPVSVLFNYGNGTSHWYNTTTSSGRDFYNITLWLTDNRVESTYYSNLNEHFVQSINGVRSSGSYYWQLWIYCTVHDAWFYSDWGADSSEIAQNDTVRVTTPTGSLTLQSNTFAWNYQDHILPPVPGAAQTDTCSS